MAKISASGLVGVLVLLAMVSSTFVVVEAAKIETFNDKSCDGTPTNSIVVDRTSCQKFDDQSAVRISEVSSNTRVSVYSTQNCQAGSQVAQIFGPGCVIQGATWLKSVSIA